MRLDAQYPSQKTAEAQQNSFMDGMDEIITIVTIILVLYISKSLTFNCIGYNSYLQIIHVSAMVFFY